jgi:N6-adenosine-specific RNA methylase IME4
MFDGLKRGHYGAILADPPWTFQAWYAGGWRVRPDGTKYHSAASPKAARYHTMDTDDICEMPVASLAIDDCVLFLWGVWPMFPDCLRVMTAWGFEYKSCAFVWTKANSSQLEMFRDDITPDMLLGYWTRANSEFCLLGTRGNPKRLATDVRQAIVEPRREHSRKPDCVYERIERLIAGPYLELFARQSHPGWDCWGNEIDKFAPSYSATDDFARSIDDCYCEIRERKANGGKGWGGWE